jgi:hypothetical protein
MNNNLSKEREDLTAAEKSIRDTNAKLDMLKVVEDVSVIVVNSYCNINTKKT